MLSSKTPAAINDSTSLYEMVKKIQLRLLPEATGKKSFVINDVSKSDFVDIEEKKLCLLFGNLLRNAINRTSDCCIRIQTETVNGEHRLCIRNNGNCSYSSYINSLVPLTETARAAGANIGLDAIDNRGITVFFVAAADPS